MVKNTVVSAFAAVGICVATFGTRAEDIQFDVEFDSMSGNYNFKPSGELTATFTANCTPGWMAFGNDAGSSESFGTTIFTAAEDSLGVNSGVWYVGAGSGSGGVRVEKGTYTASGFVIGETTGKTGVVEIAGGTVYSTGDPNVGMSGAGTLTVGSGGVFWSGAGFGSKVWTQIAKNAGSTGTINLNAGGEMYASQINKGGAGSAYVNFNGGRLTVIYGGDTLLTSGIVVTVGAQGGTIDTAGYSTTIATAVDGEGTLTITGGGVVTFTQKPTCPVIVEKGVLLLTSDTTPESITLGVDGYLVYDLSNVHSSTDGDVTTMPANQVLAANVTITVPEGGVAAEHVAVKNDNIISWTVMYYDNTLVAANPTTEAYATGKVTVWTGNLNNGISDQRASWSNGIPGENSKTVKAVIPFTSTMNLWHWLYCGELYLVSDLTVQKTTNRESILPRSVTGSGTLTLNADGEFGYLCSQSDSKCDIYVPVVMQGAPWVRGTPEYPVTFHNSLTIVANATLTEQSGENNGLKSVILAGDVRLDGTYTTYNNGSETMEIASGKTLSGVGTLDGSLELNGIVAPGTSTAEKLTVTGAATFNSGSSLLVTIGEDGASSRLVLTGEDTVDVSNISVDVANKSALVRNSGYEYKVMTAESGCLIGQRRGGVKASDGSFWRTKISSDAKSLVLVQSFGGLAVFVR